ncbi:hypothetical protein C9374_004688 [Naegleria lovaniensis]|uniref:Uncharacterized protein n=1 Tax=Naegleria lovaniensis TaxID=51637 RepID=A0AA88GQC1_NAELO|nr:uncharacterized protein C9374_004688 [Naegleria lovaniensis]KAG2383351.1 hypothetical protein C9374_004688 [Naegleria lovaniensis]
MIRHKERLFSDQLNYDNRSNDFENTNVKTTGWKKRTIPQTAKGRPRNASSSTRLQGKEKSGFGNLYGDDDVEDLNIGQAAHAGDASQLELASLSNSDDELPTSYNESISNRTNINDNITSRGVVRSNSNKFEGNTLLNKEIKDSGNSKKGQQATVSSSLNSAQFLSMAKSANEANSTALNPQKKSIGGGMIASAPSSPAKRSHPSSYMRTKTINVPKSPNASVNTSQIMNPNQNTFQTISALFEKKIQRLENERKICNIN